MDCGIRESSGTVVVASSTYCVVLITVKVLSKKMALLSSKLVKNRHVENLHFVEHQSEFIVQL